MTKETRLTNGQGNQKMASKEENALVNIIVFTEDKKTGAPGWPLGRKEN